ncbi:MAG TPA: hypothetical protein VIN08_05175 [Ohtaekwangia sp.]|uniref:LVIVD repeat-containing protein n=1 Tax=Ohtaekwangia sp. TaxID=2066019 RepID=UPI002F9282F8
MDTLENRLQKRIHVSLYALLFLTGLLGISVLLEGCTDKCEVTNEYTAYKPVYTSLEEIRKVSITQPEGIHSVGKIYYKDEYLFVNEPGKGIHVIDNHDPASPVNKSFINIPGNYELAIKDNALYADSYIDLVVLDITSLDNIHEVNRIENIFSNYNSLGFYMDPEKGLVTDWVAEKNSTVLKSDCNSGVQPWGGVYYDGGIALASNVTFDKSAAIAPGNGSGPGVGGSMARFTISKNHLYALDAGNIIPVDISDEVSPDKKTSVYIGWNSETIFPAAQNLFIGASDGMYILDISDPAVPKTLTTYSHIRSCDPVVVDGNYAYVTLRSGTTCQGFTNQLEVIDIQNLQSPQLLKTYPMTNPHGLGKDNTTLFICDGSDGLKVYDASDINTIDKKQLAHYDGINAYDVIPFDNVLMMIGENGLYQYDYSDPANIKLLSHLAIVHEN